VFDKLGFDLQANLSVLSENYIEAQELINEAKKV
jgi:hypothetical protein